MKVIWCLYFTVEKKVTWSFSVFEILATFWKKRQQNVAKISKTEKLQATVFSTAKCRHHMTFTMIACCHKCLKHYLEQKVGVLVSFLASWWAHFLREKSQLCLRTCFFVFLCVFSELPKRHYDLKLFFFQQTCLLDINGEEKVQYLADTMLSSPFFWTMAWTWFHGFEPKFEKKLKKNEKIEKTNNFFSKIFSTRNEE